VNIVEKKKNPKKKEPKKHPKSAEKKVDIIKVVPKGKKRGRKKGKKLNRLDSGNVITGKRKSRNQDVDYRYLIRVRGKK